MLIKDLLTSREEKVIIIVQKFIIVAVRAVPSLLSTKGSKIFKFIALMKDADCTLRFRVN